ncbi:hypothetical protein HG536_0D04120 [Torulaspora globosa]|uniref:DUF2423 domain-containing protein n=1 Tax=Torulaspora globosa TaxID=48254 RepID=A0A7G3ZHA4_9SACH|nr:uncharacterized protein HG536_0D04120 [Torulaspora globosa]QLL32890.1 hypothetical protein HG536_0D04120 [Torulaspora globosa]
MAKSLRASSHLKAKSVKRRHVFQKVVDARAARISEKLKGDLVQQKLKEMKDGGAMEVDDSKKEVRKISTSGWRDARHHNYKKAKKIKNSKKKGSFTKF